MKKLLFTLTVPLLPVFGMQAAEIPDFHLSFDNTADARLPQKTESPEVKGRLVYVPGIRGQALEITDAHQTVLCYPSNGLIGEKGTISMWVKPYWNGLPETSHYYLFQTQKDNGQKDFRFWFWTWLRGDVPLKNGGGIIELKGGTRDSVTRNDWLHVAMVWNRRNWSKIYVNGEEVAASRFTGIDLEMIRRFSIGSAIPGEGRFNGAVDEVKIFRKPLSSREIRAEYRSSALFDLTMDETFVNSGKNIVLEVSAAPQGTRTGNALDKNTEKSASAAVSMRLFDSAEKCIGQQDFGTVRLQGPQTLPFQAGTLVPGHYRLEVSMRDGDRSIVRTFKISVTDVKPENAPDGPIVCGESFFRKQYDSLLGSEITGTLNGRKYREAASEKMSRIYCEVPIPEQYRNGELLMLELEWPDDKPRMAAFYLHSGKGSQSIIRDRLGQGLISGGAYPLSGKMQKVRYFFYAGLPEYLFEARTMAAGKPAAIASIRLSRVKEPLPALKINLPPNMRGRSIGHLDEDQSFEYNLDWDNTRPKMSRLDVETKFLRKLCEYFAYTGQNYFSLPLLRYDFTAYERTTVPGFRGNIPFMPGSIPFWMKSLHENGIEFTAIINLWAPPEMTLPDQKSRFILENYYSRDKDGAVLEKSCNPLHPEVRKLLERNIEDFASRFAARKGLTGIDLWLEWDSFGFRSLDNGYDDESVGRFSRETGLTIPAFAEQKYQRRHQFLTTGENRKRWVAWRAEQTTQQIRRVREIINRYNPALPLYVTVSGFPMRGDQAARTPDTVDFRKNILEEQCLDIDAVNAIPNVYVTPMRFCTDQYWIEHWSGGYASTEELLLNPAVSAIFRNPRGNYVSSYREYFETFSKSPLESKFPAYFQNADLKPHGRFFLKELAYSLAMTDAQRIAFGAQPLAALGFEELVREFVRAYRALPDRPFQDAAGAGDPVTVRFLQTENGTYLYAVNLIHCPGEVILQLPGASGAEDLSSGQKLPVQNGRLTVSLKPFELRSFLIPGKTVPALEKVLVPQDFRNETEKRFKDFEYAERELAAAGIRDKALKDCMEKCRKAYSEGRFAELYRLFNSKLMGELSQKISMLKNGFLSREVRMLEESHFAVNCGSSEYLLSGDTLFLPDMKWEDGTTNYGYTGKGTLVARNTEKMPESPLRPLFQTERYDISGYRFKVKDGKYTLKASMRVGYEPARKNGIFVVDAAVNGKTVEKAFDLFQREGKNGYAQIIVRDIRPQNGIISFELTTQESSTVRLLNAIEIIPQ